MEIDNIYNKDCLEGMKKLPDKSIDLIVTDPPYLVSTKGGGFVTKNKKEKVFSEIASVGIERDLDHEVLTEMVRLMKKINIYIWCNHKQIPQYLDYFVKELGCNFDIIIWNKTNVMPLYKNKWLTDKEYCLYFRKGGYCNPPSYADAKTVFTSAINKKDKKMYGHPTIKPLDIIKTLISNSSREGDVILDPFLGSGTTAVAAKILGRRYIGFERQKEYFDTANKRLEEVQV